MTETQNLNFDLHLQSMLNPSKNWTHQKNLKNNQNWKLNQLPNLELCNSEPTKDNSKPIIKNWHQLWKTQIDPQKLTAKKSWKLSKKTKLDTSIQF